MRPIAAEPTNVPRLLTSLAARASWQRDLFGPADDRRGILSEPELDRLRRRIVRYDDAIGDRPCRIASRPIAPEPR